VSEPPADKTKVRSWSPPSTHTHTCTRRHTCKGARIPYTDRIPVCFPCEWMSPRFAPLVAETETRRGRVWAAAWFVASLLASSLCAPYIHTYHLKAGHQKCSDTYVQGRGGKRKPNVMPVRCAAQPALPLLVSLVLSVYQLCAACVGEVMAWDVCWLWLASQRKRKIRASFRESSFACMQPDTRINPSIHCCVRQSVT